MNDAATTLLIILLITAFGISLCFLWVLVKFIEKSIDFMSQEYPSEEITDTIKFYYRAKKMVLGACVFLLFCSFAFIFIGLSLELLLALMVPEVMILICVLLPAMIITTYKQVSSDVKKQKNIRYAYLISAIA